MKKVMIAGSGKIGSLIAVLLVESKSYEVMVVDNDIHQDSVKKLVQVFPKIQIHQLDVKDIHTVKTFMKQFHIDAVVSALPFYLNEYIAQAAKIAEVHYFDLTEDIETTKKIKLFAANSKICFVPQCGVAPGFINIITEHLMQSFENCYEVNLRVGGLPLYIDNALKYGLTWSVDGLINQYCNLCPAIESGKLVMHRPLEGLEVLVLDGCEYEAFNTSGGVGHLVEKKLGSVDHLNYKTIRYPGHCEKMRFLIHDLKLFDDKATLIKILEKSLPKIEDDILIFYASVTGYTQGNLSEKHYFQKIFPNKIKGTKWTAMQTATASSLCAVLDIVLQNLNLYQGLILHEKFDFNDFKNNRFAKCFC
jgi:saccharopine dehydrogenase-like NADP-dependent oxidoreductase